MGRICSACHEEFAKARFSNKQWAARKHRRRCKECTAKNLPSVPFPDDERGDAASYMASVKSPVRSPIDYIDKERAMERVASIPADDDPPHCFICLEESSTDNVLLRDCSCRGGSGWAHFECLIEYSAQKYIAMFEAVMIERKGTEQQEFSDVWTQCPNCLQPYRNDLELATSAGHVEFVKNTMYEKAENDTGFKAYLLFESNLLLLVSLTAHLDYDELIYDEAKHLGNTMLKKWLPKLSKICRISKQRLLEMDADIHRSGLAPLSQWEGDVGAAIEHNKHALQIFERLNSGEIPLEYGQDYEAKIASVEAMIDQLHEMSKAENQEEIELEQQTDDKKFGELDKSRRLYELTKRDAGETSCTAISIGIDYGWLLFRSQSSLVKSLRLATQLFEDSSRIFGPDHGVTQSAKELYDDVRKNPIVSLLHPEIGFVKFYVMGHCVQEDRYVLQIPSEEYCAREGIDVEQYNELREFPFLPIQRSICILNHVVPILVGGMPPGPLENLNGKIGETRLFKFSEESHEYTYTIQFESDDIHDCQLPAQNLLVLNKLPPPGTSVSLSFLDQVFNTVRLGSYDNSLQENA